MVRLLSLLLLLAALPAVAQEPCPRRRNVDCAAAQHAIAAAIAADPWLSLIDRARRMRVAELAALLGPAGAAELTAQDAAQRRTLSRELFFTSDGVLEPDSLPGLRLPMEFWLMRLMRMQPDPPPSLGGRWVSMNGEAVVRHLGGGGHAVAVNTVDPYALAWTCEYDGQGRTDRVERLETEDGALELSWDGPMLRISMLTTTAAPFCGAAGSVAGRYFRIGDAE